MYDEHEVRVIYKGNRVLSGGRELRTCLWLLIIAEKDKKQQEVNMAHATLDLQMPLALTATNASHIVAVSVYTPPYKQQLLKYMHQTFFNIPIPTLINAIQNEQLEGFP